MKQYLVLYGATLVVMAALDALWIGGIAKDFYKTRLGDQLEFHPFPAILFYLMYAAGVVIFVNGTPGASWQSTAIYGALLGFLAYGTYDLTNLATLRGWSVSLVLVDMAWGTLVTAVSATAGRAIADYFLR